MTEKENRGIEPKLGGLKRDLSLSMLIFYGVGTILGLGIYVLIGRISGEAKMLAPFAVMVAGILAAFTGLSYAELSARIPKSAGEVNYVHRAFGKAPLSAAIGWMIVLSAIVSTATVVNGYVGYVQIFLDLPPWIIISGFVVILGSVAIWGIRESAILIMFITVIEIAGILLVIILGADSLADLPSRFSELMPDFKLMDWQLVASGAFLAFFAYIGFEDMVNVSEEAKNPRRDMPRAIIVSLTILTLVYIIVALIAVLSLSPEELYNSEAPLADIVAVKGEIYPKIIGLVSLVAIVNGVLVQMIMCSRMLFGMAEINMAPKVFHRVNPKTRTPILGTLFTMSLVLILALSFDLVGLAKATSYILLTVFMVVNLALVAIKRKEPYVEGVRSRPMWVPILGFLFSLLVMVMEIISIL